MDNMTAAIWGRRCKGVDVNCLPKYKQLVRNVMEEKMQEKDTMPTTSLFVKCARSG